MRRGDGYYHGHSSRTRAAPTRPRRRAAASTRACRRSRDDLGHGAVCALESVVAGGDRRLCDVSDHHGRRQRARLKVSGTALGLMLAVVLLGAGPLP